MANSESTGRFKMMCWQFQMMCYKAQSPLPCPPCLGKPALDVPGALAQLCSGL